MAASVLLLTEISGWTATYTVNNATDFNNLPRLNAGDVVQMNSGTYGAINKTLESSISDDTTAKNSPILVYAVTPGGVVIDAPSKIILSGRGIILAGLDFSPNSGILSGSSYILGTASASRYMTFSNIRFRACSAPTGAMYGNWIYIQGFYHAVEFCSFQDRPDTIPAPLISFMPNIAEGGVTVPRMHRVSYCYFGPRYVGTVNGFETIRIGVGDAQTFDMQVTIEHNLFYRSIWRSDLTSGGEPEIISNKSKGNKILYNTFLESQGGICLRSGDYGTVEGNYIFGAGTQSGTNIILGTTLASQNGIRVIGQNHVIRNNYIENITGSDIHAALCLMSGESDYYPGNPATGATNNGSYSPAHNAQIYNNTFVNCYQINLGFLSTDSYTNSSGAYVAKSPTNVLFYNNAWQGNGTATAALSRDISSVSGYTPIVLGGSGGNYIYETSSAKYGWISGLSNSTFSTTTAGVSSNFDNYKVPTSTSPLLDKASNTLVAIYDVRGLTRPTNNQDIGCFERSVAGSGFKPLLRTNVGTGFDGGPTNSYPQAGSGDSKPTILTTTIQSASVGTAYSQTLQSSGGDGILTWSISAGTLPAGLSLLPGTGVISGTPATNAVGTYTFTARVTDSDTVGPDSAEQSYTLTVYSAGGAKLSIGTVMAYSTASGTKTSYSYDAKTGTRWSSLVTSKNPNSTGTNFGTDCTWIWWDLGENKSLSSVKLNWYNGSTRTYSYRLDSTTNTNSWSTILARTNSSMTNQTNGYETVNLSSASGRYVRLVCWGSTATNGNTHINEIEIYGSTYVAPDSRQTQSIIFGSLGSAVENDPPVALSAYSLSASNTYTGLPITYESSDPTVASIDGTTLTITGGGSVWITASQAGDTNYRAATSVQQLFTVTPLSPGITSASSVTAVRGLPFRFQITADRPVTGYGATGLPAGLSVDPATGKIVGTATVSGLSTVTVSAQNSSGTGSATLNLNVIEPYVYETFESYTNGQAVPLASPTTLTSGIKASGQVTNAAGNSVIGGTTNKVAWFNDSTTATSAQLEFNAGASGQSYLAASFELYNNATPSTSGSMPLSVAFAAWNSANNTTVGGSNAKRIATIEFNQFGSLTTPAYSIKGSTTNNFTYSLANKQTVHLFANDHDTNTINYVGPDGNVRTLSTNSFAVFLNGGFIGMYGLNPTATANDGTTILTGNNNLGRLCFNTTSGNTGNWLIDNVVVSDMPTDVVVPPPAAPTITSPSTGSGQAGFSFTYTTTNLEVADNYALDGVLPSGLTFSTVSGIISGTPNQSGVFPIVIYANNEAGSGTLAVTLTIAPAPPNIFSGTDPSLNTAASWSLGAAPNASSSGGSYTDLVFNSSATNLTTSSGNINGKSWNVTNGSNYFLSSVRDTNSAGGTLYKIGNTGTNDTTPFTNTVTSVENEMVFLSNNSSMTLSSQSISNSIPATAQLRNSGIMRIASGSTFNVACNLLQSSASSAYAITKRGGGKLVLSGSNSYTGATTVEQGTLVLSGSGTSPTTIKTGAVLELALSNSASVLGAGLTLELGSQVRIIGTPASGQTYTLAAASAVTNNATLETAIPGFQLSVSGSSLVLMPASLINPTITWSNPAAITYGTALSSTQLNASSSAAGTFAYNPTNGTVLPAGTNTLKAIFSATDTNSYVSPVTNSVTLVVNKATPVITVAPTASPINSGQALTASTLTGGAASVAGSFAFTAPSTVPGVGTSTQGVTFTPADAANYNPATTSVSVLVNQAVVSSDAALVNLTLSSGTLSPTFSSNTTSYTATVSNLLAIQVTPTVSQSNATVQVNGSTVASGAASGKIRLLPGTNTITTVVTAQDGTTKTYTVAVTQNDEFDILRSRWQATLISNGLAASSVSSIGSKAYGFWKTNTASLNTNATSADAGLWSDLPMDAGDATASGNMVTSFSRLYKMAQAYVTPGCTVAAITVTNGSTNTNTVTLTGNSELGGAIVKGMDWMVANVYTTNGVSYGNWFDWEVQGAQYFTDAQTLMYAQLSADQILNYADAIDNYGPNSVNMQDYFFWGALTGANTTSVALVAAVNGIVSKDAAKIAEITAPQGVPKVFPLVTDGDGFYADGSYIFHGNVAYNGHYGMVMLEGVVTLATLLDGSTWTIYDPVKFPNVYTWITKGFQPFFYQGAFMDCVRGRSVGTSGETGPDVGTELLGYIQKVAGFVTTPSNLATSYNAFVANPHPATGQYHFPNMDRVVAHRANYSLALSMSSTRVNNYEDLFGDANTKGYFQGDGMTYLYVGSKDTQFTNGYWPSVDIYHLTGTTTEQGTVSTPSATDQHFVGGADVRNTNGTATYGVAAFALHPVLSSGTSTLNAKKSYFMLENEVICLGAGITAGSANEIHTTVENRAMGSNVSTATLWVNGTSTSRALASSNVLTNVTNCAIEGVGGYHFFNAPGNLQAAFQQSSGTWGAIHPGDSDATIYTNNYLKLYYKHGVRPTNASYAYAILPTMSPAAVAAYSRNPQTTILSNSSSVQAVKNATLGVVAANFWGASGGTADLLTADKACSVIAYETVNGISVGISDPSQTLSGSNGVITVTLNRAATGTVAVDDGVTVVRTSPTIQLQADVSGMKGSTLHASFSLEAAPVITGNMNVVAQTGTAMSYQITSDTAGATYGATGLPPGLSLYGSGLIYGTPTASGTYTATISATNAAGRTGYATLTFQLADTLSSIATTYGSTTTWVCPANVTAVQVEAWGAGGAGGSGVRGGTSKAATGGGGAGGAYARINSYPVTAGLVYYINVGSGGVSSTNHLAAVAGGDSWFNSNNVPSTLVLAKGGAGGQSIVNTNVDTFGTGGVGTATGSLGDVVRAGGSGATSTTNGFGGGGGGSAGTSSAGNAPTSTTNGLGAVAVTGGGNGGNANATAGSSGDGQSPTAAPGGGGGGARAASSVQRYGGTGGAGQVVITIKALATATNPPSGPSFSSLFGGLNPTNVGSDGLAYLVKYALGGSNVNDKVTLPTVNQNGTTLTMTAIVRTNDSSLTMVGQTVTDLSGAWANLSSNPYGTASANTNNVPAGCQRREFTVNGGTNERAFLRLKATQNP